MSDDKPSGNRFGPLFHWFVVLLFFEQVLYSVYQVFWVLAPDGHVGPLGDVAATISPEQLIARRLYSIEGWIAGGAVLLYLAITRPGLFRR